MLTQLVALVIRGYAIWLALQSVRAFGALMEMGVTRPQSDAALMGLGTAEIGLAIALWFFPYSFAKKLCPPSENADFSGLTPGGLYTAGMILLGLFWISKAVYGLFYWAAYLALAGRDPTAVPIEGINPLSVTMDAASAVLGLSLIIGRHGIKAAILRLRYGDQDRADF